MIKRTDVKHIASLARIHLEDGEIDSLTKNLEDILHYVAKLEKLDVSKVKPTCALQGTCRVLSQKNVTRKDIVKPSLKQEDALRIAVAKHNGSFKVPQVIE